VVSTCLRQLPATRPRDLPYGEHSLVVRSQYATAENTCGRRAFTDEIREILAGERMTRAAARDRTANRTADSSSYSLLLQIGAST
jgi:hypothetical protein